MPTVRALSEAGNRDSLLSFIGADLVAVMDPHEDLVVAGLFAWTLGPPLEVVRKYLESVKKYPNPPAANITKF